MSVISLVLNKANGDLAFWADCLITSDEADEGPRLETPVSFGSRQEPLDTLGHIQTRLQSKIIQLGDGSRLLWSGELSLARTCANEIETIMETYKGPLALERIARNFESYEDSSFILVLHWESGISIIHHRCNVYQFHGFEVVFAGSGSGLLDDPIKFVREPSAASVDVSSAAHLSMSFITFGILNERTYRAHPTWRYGGWYELIEAREGKFIPKYFVLNNFSVTEELEICHNTSCVPFSSEHGETVFRFAAEQDSFDFQGNFWIAESVNRPLLLNEINGEIKPELFWAFARDYSINLFAVGRRIEVRWCPEPYPMIEFKEGGFLKFPGPLVKKQFNDLLDEIKKDRPAFFERTN
ncbi:hypothetical protein [Ruegeria arenilitoris]|uniref:hypothetical protein n=1 Tax=Ruegeria arenilitoris TaxID=1173585 RepID=UPI001481950A|nr:hypothetical protein [Ruegeria arenilitoris]